MAVACKRAYHADGVILARSIAYLIKGKIAVRFQVPEAVSREIVAFDRGGVFSPGQYHLQRPSPSMTMAFKAKNSREKRNPGGHKRKNEDKVKYKHMTTGIRTVLGSLDE
ncbi:hypothetical protein J2P12_00065 [Candidatus Bathyarchaeota archaeon]|nr:hypothetical protein [Candidatus Bathyarchaeota archaeon]